MSMRKSQQEPEQPARLVERRPEGDAPEARLAALVRAGLPAEGLGGAARDRVWQRLDRRARGGRSFASLRWSVAAGVLLTSGVVVGAVNARRWWPRLTGPRTETVAPAPRGKARAARLPAAPSVAPAIAPPAAEASAATAGVPAPRPPAAVASRAPRPLARLAPVETTAPAPLAEPAPRIEPAAPPAAAAPPTPSALANETALLSAALTRLRHDRDAAGALAALDVYDARAPHGTLRREANVARVDALLMLGRDADALAVLRTLPLQPRGREQELRVVRGELIAPSSCAAAVEDFDHVLTGAPPAPLVERALHGRATCLTKLGDLEGARRDSLEYLRRFPEGRFAAQARRLTGENDL
jgi:hypothetical protein